MSANPVYPVARRAVAHIAGLCCALLLPFHATQASAATHDDVQAVPAYVLANPDSALLSPTSGRLSVSQKLPVRKAEDNGIVEFVIPMDASNLQLAVAGRTIIRWDITPVTLRAASAHATRRAAVEAEQNSLAAKLVAVKARLAVWQAQTQQASAQDMEQRQVAMAQQMPALALEQEHLEKRLNIVRQELAQLPAHGGIGQLVTVTLAGDGEENAHIRYSYDLASCGWQPVYEFNARPAEKSGDEIDVRLLAEVWQYTGMDWRNTTITIATLGKGSREPAPLPSWVVGEQPAKPQPKAAGTHAMARAAAAAPMMLNAVAPDAAPVLEDTDSLYASWTLSAKGLPEGRAHLQIMADTWKAPLQWLARPSIGDNRVWLMCKYELPQNQAWPDGVAQFSVDGQSIGSGAFKARGNETTLYFGADPRVRVHTTIDTNRQGQTGFINTSKTWTGAWTYTLTNEHNRAVKVKVERPAPMVANENITVTYKDTPKSDVDEKEHMVYWDIEVPAHGKSVIEHSITISSPEKLPLLPDVS